MNYNIILQGLYALHNDIYKVIDVYYVEFKPKFETLEGKEWIKPIKPICTEAIELYNLSEKTKNPELRKEADRIKANFQMTKEMINYRINIVVYKYAEKRHYYEYMGFIIKLSQFIQEYVGIHPFLDSIQGLVWKVPDFTKKMNDIVWYKPSSEDMKMYYDLLLKYISNIKEQLKHETDIN